MHFPTPAPLLSGSFDEFTQDSNGFAVYANPKRHLVLCLGNAVGAIFFGSFCIRGMNDAGWLGQVVPNLMGLLAAFALLCAVQSLIWLLLKHPSLQVDAKTVTVYLTGLQPITLQQSEIKSVVLHGVGGAKFNVALEPVSPQIVRKGLSLFDRFYFAGSEKIIGFGFSYTVVLPPDGQAKLIQQLRSRFGGRVNSTLPEPEAILSEA